ncbi:ABC transporter substrate-binding protein [Moraxella nasicaprae]|uniref:ABC transporter substrate-binding protein n=1 Tax=Moraxella nasicaprae TaxID=2904122 RepID=A0ABY6F5R3_9GAMM|nr:ABC transporter substrate-binding protein [Moraxella nasicaprae]UXZ05431.1 ABC transporter substrate-binding protein [Moraxella nasicaprae]
MSSLTKTALVAALSIAMGLTACSSETPTKETQASQSSQAKNSLTINNASEPESLDPHLAQGVQEANIIRQFSEGLVSTDNDGNLIAGMATEWSSPDNKVWTFKLRDAKWSNGDPVTAEDFVFSFRRLVNPETGSSYASYLADAQVLNAQAIIDGKAAIDTLGVKAIDDKTLQITLSEPVPYFVDMMVHSAVQPVHPATIEKFGEKWTDPANIVVNGAYKPTEWLVNEKIVLTRNEHYYDNSKTSIDELIILPISQATTDVVRYQAGEVDITASELPPEQFADLKATLGDELKTAPTLCTYYYDLNQAKAPFDNEKVRRALMLSFDRELIADKVMGQGQPVAYQFTPTAIKGNLTYTPEWQSWDRAKRIETAKQLLSEAGYNQNNPLNFTLLYDTNESHKKIAVAAASMWKDAFGFVNAELINQEWKTYLDSRRNGNYQMVRARWCGDYNEASTFLNLRKSNNTNNWSGFKDPQFDALMEQSLRADVDDAARIKLYQDAERIMDENSTQIDIFYYANVRLVKPYVQGYSNKDPLDLWQAKYWSIKK